MNFSFGTDPEFILIDEKGNLKSAISVLKKDKKNKIFYDNVLAECTVEPSFSKKQVVENIKNSIICCAEFVKPYKITNISAGEYSNKELDHPEARKSGCDAEFCAYELKKVSTKKIKKIFKKSNLRTAGGHIHLGTDLGKNYETCIMLVRMLDLFLGLASLDLDRCCERRKIYGSAGRYRQPSYGLEYRTLGNFWLASPVLVELIYDLCHFVVKATEEKIYENFWHVDYETLNSDDFWNSNGDPSKCHYCHAYDASLLQKLFHMQKEDVEILGKNIKEFAYSFMPDSIVKKIKELKNCKFEIYKEWGI